MIWCHSSILSLSDGIEEILDRVLNLILVVNGLVFLNLTLRHFSRVAAVKELMLLGVFVCALVRPLRRSGVAALTVLFMVNPGLSLYTLLVRDLFSAAQAGTFRGVSVRLQRLRSVAEQEFRIAFSATGDESLCRFRPRLFHAAVPAVRKERDRACRRGAGPGRRYVEGTTRMVKTVAGTGTQYLLDTAVRYFVLAVL